MAELTIEQKRAVAMAQARLRLQSQQQAQQPAQAAAPPRFDSVPTVFGGSGAPQSGGPPKQGIPQGPVSEALSGIGQRVNKEVVGFGEGLLSLATGIPTSLAGGLRTVGGLVTGEDPRAAAEAGQSVMGSNYQPRTAEGQQWVGAAANVMSLPGRAVGAGVERAADAAGAGNGAPEARGELARALTDMTLTAAGARPAMRAGAAAAPVINDAVGATARGVGRVAAAPINAFRPTHIAEKMLQRDIGMRPDQMPPLVDRLRQPSTITDKVPDGGLTAAQMVSGMPEGTVLQALQEKVAQVPQKGISIDFAKRWQAQENAIKVARADLETELAPMRKEVIANIQQRGGIPAQSLVASLRGIAGSPQAAGNAMTRSVIRDFQNLIRDNIRKDGTIDPEVLYTYRKTGLKQAISNASNGDITAAKQGMLGVGTSIRGVIDESFGSNGGGSAWANYLQRYSTRAKEIDAFEETFQQMKNPKQRSNVSGVDQPFEGDIRAPQMLNRPVQLTNYGLGMFRKWMTPKVDAIVADRLQNPAALAEVLAKVEKRPPKQKPIDDPSRLLPRPSDMAVEVPSATVVGERAARPWGDSRVAPPFVPRLPSPDQPLSGGTGYRPTGPMPLTEKPFDALSHPGSASTMPEPQQLALADALRQSAAQADGIPFENVLIEPVAKRTFPTVAGQRGRGVKQGEAVGPGVEKMKPAPGAKERGMALELALQGKKIPPHMRTALARAIQDLDKKRGK